ncbi:DUF1178 family protein [Futiania mangrovi]|uniref:DUF1178 family protein n=1 Tax=Futiania mangrovi TaxID=2959716 RepID=A0A9J6P8Q3_9PROT|nr:DUF1178 family protein [Futiania mangrovii]MCP1336140.1 DUF1178 family protein [Futiania mangrovii]
MIRYALRCTNGHDFDGWFRSAADYEAQAEACEVTCPQCGSALVEKAPMAPAIARGGREEAAPEAHQEVALSPRDVMLAKLAQLREHVEKTFENVGDRFAAEARAIHEGRAEERGIYGEARGDEVKALIDDGVPVAPLPPAPKVN